MSVVLSVNASAEMRCQFVQEVVGGVLHSEAAGLAFTMLGWFSRRMIAISLKVRLAKLGL